MTELSKTAVRGWNRWIYGWKGGQVLMIL